MCFAALQLEYQILNVYKPFMGVLSQFDNGHFDYGRATSLLNENYWYTNGGIRAYNTRSLATNIGSDLLILKKKEDCGFTLSTYRNWAETT